MKAKMIKQFDGFESQEKIRSINLRVLLVGFSRKPILRLI